MKKNVKFMKKKHEIHQKKTVKFMKFMKKNVKFMKFMKKNREIHENNVKFMQRNVQFMKYYLDWLCAS